MRAPAWPGPSLLFFASSEKEYRGAVGPLDLALLPKREYMREEARRALEFTAPNYWLIDAVGVEGAFGFLQDDSPCLMISDQTRY